jgi:hypothetical protein
MFLQLPKLGGDTKVSQLDKSLLGRQNVGTLDGAQPAISNSL